MSERTRQDVIDDQLIHYGRVPIGILTQRLSDALYEWYEANPIDRDTNHLFCTLEAMWLIDTHHNGNNDG